MENDKGRNIRLLYQICFIPKIKVVHRNIHLDKKVRVYDYFINP